MGNGHTDQTQGNYSKQANTFGQLETDLQSCFKSRTNEAKSQAWFIQIPRILLSGLKDKE